MKKLILLAFVAVLCTMHFSNALATNVENNNFEKLLKLFNQNMDSLVSELEKPFQSLNEEQKNNNDNENNAQLKDQDDEKEPNTPIDHKEAFKLFHENYFCGKVQMFPHWKKHLGAESKCSNIKKRDFWSDAAIVETFLNHAIYNKKDKNAQQWAQIFTDSFEIEHLRDALLYDKLNIDNKYNIENEERLWYAITLTKIYDYNRLLVDEEEEVVAQETPKAQDQEEQENSSPKMQNFLGLMKSHNLSKKFVDQLMKNLHLSKKQQQNENQHEEVEEKINSSSSHHRILTNYLDLAEEIFSWVSENYWDETCGKGGIFSNDKRLIKESTVNQLFIMLADALYESTIDPTYFYWAKRSTDWFFESDLYDTESGYIYESMTDNCKTINKNIWTHNQAMLLTVFTRLTKTLEDFRYVNMGKKMLFSLLEKENGFVYIDEMGRKILRERKNSYEEESAHFKGIFMRHLGYFMMISINSKFNLGFDQWEFVTWMEFINDNALVAWENRDKNMQIPFHWESHKSSFTSGTTMSGLDLFDINERLQRIIHYDPKDPENGVAASPAEMKPEDAKIIAEILEKEEELEKATEKVEIFKNENIKGSRAQEFVSFLREKIQSLLGIKNKKLRR